MATGFGAIPIEALHGGKPVTHRYYVPSTDSTAIFKGDFVGLVNAMDPKNEVAVVKALGATGDEPVGVVVGFEPDPSDVYKGHYRTASTNRYVLVADDPDQLFAIQEDAVGGSVSAANVGSHYNADIALGAGSTVTGVSGHMLDSDTAAATTAVLKIHRVLADGTNAAAQSGGAILVVSILEHALRTADSIT